MQEQGGVGIVFNASRSGRCLLVKSLVHGGAAVKSCAVEEGYQIIAVGDKDVSSCTLEEVADMLRGPVGTEVHLKFLETRQVKLNMERCVFMNDGTPSVGIRWRNGLSEMIVEGMLPGYQGFGGTPKAGDRLLSIGGESIEHMPDDEIWARLAGPQDSSVRLEFARGVAHHSVSLVRQALTLVPASAHVASESNDEEKTITAAPINFAREIQATHNKEAASVKAFSSKSPSANYLPAAEQFSDSGVQHVAVMSRNDMDLLNKPTSSQPLQTITPNKEVTHKEVPMVIKTKSLSNHSSISGAVHAAVDQNNVSCSQANDSSNRPDSAIPRIGVNCRISPSTANSHHFSERMTAPPPRAVHLVQDTAKPHHETTGTPHASSVMEKYGPAPDDDYLPAQEDVCGAAVDEHTGEGLTASSDPTQLVLKKQLVDIAKRLKREVEDKDLEIASLREAQGNPDALQKLVEKGQEQIRALRDRLKAQQQKLTEAESCIKHKDSELSSVKGVLMRRAEKSGQSKKQLDDLTSSFMTLCDEKKTLAIERDKLEADLRAMEVELRDLRQSREHDHKSFRDAAELTVKWKMEEVGKQVKELQEELKIKRDECASANTQLLGMQQQLVREQETIDSTNAKLQEARVELQRVREAASNSCNMVQEYKSKCSQLEREAAAAGQRCEELARNAQECKNMLEQASIFHAEKMKAADAAWESRNLILQQEISKQASEHEKLVEDKNVKYALLQAEMEEARGLMEEARTKILSLEDEKTKLSEKLEGSRKRVEELEKDCDRLTEESAAAAQLNKETIEEMQATFLDEEDTLKQQIAAMTARKEEVENMLSDAEQTIMKQSEATKEERRASEEQTNQLASQVHKLNEELRAHSSLQVELEVAQGRLRGMEQLQTRVMLEAQQHEDFRMQFRGQQGIPYPQLVRMVEDSSISLKKMQGVIASKDQELIFCRSQLGDMCRSREMAAEAEAQLWKLKESLDWKTIAVQQMVAALSNCQDVMRRYGVSEEEMDEVNSTLSVSQQHATKVQVDTSKWPSAQQQQQKKQQQQPSSHLRATSVHLPEPPHAPEATVGTGQGFHAGGIAPPPPKPLPRVQMVSGNNTLCVSSGGAMDNMHASFADASRPFGNPPSIYGSKLSAPSPYHSQHQPGREIEATL